ncbi:hypothetical protein NM208_g10687 [Fusarium decemcellulare]|uniref:Uncharacterized protein n=1 Tax=Fusarium decemcellulare TaxID=57161 RepID=A0ACC1RX17_9HYPO|nr:hypothetical protein NM208_g10687 [Fusarium decemcellulare]
MASPPHIGVLHEENIALRQILGYRLETVETSPYSPPQIGQCLPGTLIKDVLLVSIDVDAKYYEAISTDDDFYDPRGAITSYQFIYWDSPPCNYAEKHFPFRETKLVTLEPEEASQNSVRPRYPTFASQISSLIGDRDYVLLAHGTHAEVKFLSNIDPEIIHRASYVLDTVKAAQFPLQMSYRYRLDQLLDEFGIRYALLHTAGNDAHFALKALLMIAVRDSQLVPGTAAPSDEDLFRYLDAIAHARCNLPVGTETPLVASTPPKPKVKSPKVKLVVKVKDRRRRERDANRQAFQELPFADEPPTD